MRIEFRETFRLPPEVIFGYFRTPADWVRLYGLFGEVEDRGDGWVAVPLQGFPFPLVARVTDCVEEELVHWIFRGFWRGEGEVRIAVSPDGTVVQGFEEISVRWLWVISRLVESLVLERRFRGIWKLGWRRLRELEPLQGASSDGGKPEARRFRPASV